MGSLRSHSRLTESVVVVVEVLSSSRACIVAWKEDEVEVRAERRWM